MELRQPPGSGMTGSPRPPVAGAGSAGPLGPAAAPPAWVPLSFLAAAGAGLIGGGFGVWFAADRLAESPTHPGAVSAVHVAVLAFLTVGVLGALHQFAPVVGRRPLRSTRAAGVTVGAMVATAWLLPSGFAHGPDWLVPAAGVLGLATVILAAWNLSGPLSSKVGGLPLWGLRISGGYLVVTVAFGAVYALDREFGWFPLLSHRVLAHAHLGLLGWLGVTYVAVAEKLWPMFLLAHRPRARSGLMAVASLASGTAVAATGLLFAVPVVAWLGALVVGVGLGAHLVSLAGCVRHRRRRLEVLHGYLFASAGFVVVAATLAAVAAWPGLVSTPLRVQLVAAEVAALVGWLGLAVLGHAHKIVPFIAYSALRARGVTSSSTGEPLMFAHLFSVRLAWLGLVLGGAGFAAVVWGLAGGHPDVIAAGGAAVATAGVVVTANLAGGPRRGAGRPPASERHAAPPPSRQVTVGSPGASP